MVVVAAVQRRYRFTVLVELCRVDLLLAATRQIHLHPDTLLLPPARFAPQILLVQSVSGPAFLHIRSGIITLVALSFLLLLSVSVVVARVPVRIHLHVPLSLLTRLLVVFGLLLARQAVPPTAQYLVDGC